MIILDKEYRRKYSQICWRVNNHPSYKRKGITNDFESYEQFKEHAIDKGYRLGDHAHRPNKDKPYSCDNLDFLDEKTHRRLSGLEKRKLNPEQVKVARDAYKSGVSTRKIAKQMNVSQTLIWRVVTYQTYRDIEDV